MQAAAKKAGVDAGKRTGSSFGDSLKKWGKRGAVIAGGAITAAVGGALVSGFKRLTAIEDAEAMLRGLGHSAEDVKGIMQNAMDATEGTAIRMDAMATTAAQMVAAGIQPGKELEAVLKLVGDAATIAGGDMDGMSAIFSKVAAANRLSMSEVNQMQERGIPILQMVADQMGVTQAEVRDVVSAGQVDFELFSTAMEENLGGAAQEAGDTTRGALDNLGAYLARAGAAVLGPLQEPFKDAVNSISNWLQGLEPTFERVGEIISDWVGKAADAVKTFIQEFKDGEGAGGRFRDIVEGVGDALKTAFDYVKNTAVPALKDAVHWLKENESWLVPVAAGIGAIVAAWKTYQITMGIVRGVTAAFTAAQAALNVVLNLNPIGIVVMALVGLVAAFVTAYKRSEKFRVIVDAAWQGIKDAASAVWDFLKTYVFAPIAAYYKTLWKAAVKAKDIMVDAWNSIKAAFSAVWNWIKTKVFDRFVLGIKVLQIEFQARINKVKAIWNGIKAAFGAVKDWVQRNVFDRFKQGVQNLRDNISNVVGRIKNIWGGIKSAFKAPWDWVKTNVFGRFKDGLKNLRNNVRTMADSMGNAWRTIANKFRNPINWVLDKVWNKGIAKAFNNAAGALKLKLKLPVEARIPAFAKGGLAKKGWALVGEEGPELVNFDQPGRVYTAQETADALSLTRPGDEKATDSLPAMGGGLASRAWEGVKSAAGAVTGWVRGGLAKAADLLLSPIRKIIAPTVSKWGTFGRFAGGAMSSSIDSLVKWIRGKDDVGDAGGVQEDISGGKWRRPSRGRVTSGYGPRSLMWMGFHAGVDYAGGA